MNKEELRKTLKQQRRALPAPLRAQYSADIAARLFRTALYRDAQTMLVYLSAFGEVDTAEIIARALADGKRVAAPISVEADCSLRLSYITSMEDLAPGAYGILEPQAVSPAQPEELDLILVPGIAFDRSGGRIGFGKGYYDRFLPKTKAPKVALAYGFQLVAEACAQAHDVKMDYIITEGELVCCA